MKNHLTSNKQIISYPWALEFVHLALQARSYEERYNFFNSKYGERHFFLDDEFPMVAIDMFETTLSDLNKEQRDQILSSPLFKNPEIGPIRVGTGHIVEESLLRYVVNDPIYAKVDISSMNMTGFPKRVFSQSHSSMRMMSATRKKCKPLQNEINT